MSIERRKQIAHETVMLVIPFLLLISPPTYGQTLSGQHHDYLLQAECEIGFSGSVLVMKDDSILLAEGYGLANREQSIPNTANTKFLLCSVTKQFTATAIMQLAERGLLALNDPITKYIPADAGSSADKITIYNLLTQTSGMADYLSLVDSKETFNRPVPTAEVTSKFLNTPLEFEPGSQWQYSNSNYYLLGKIIETVSGMTYGEFLEMNIFEPLEMRNSGFPDRYLNDLPMAAVGYKANDAGELVAASAVHGNWPFAAGGLYSTANDMAKWERSLRTETVLTNESIAKMYIPYKWRYGCGWEIDTLYGHPTVSHGGMGGGYCSIIIRFVDDPFCVVVLSNSGDAFKQVSKIAYDLVAITFGAPLAKDTSNELVTVSTRLLEEYAGDYEVAPGITLSFRCRDGRMFTQGPGQPEIEIYPRSETDFFLKVTDGSVQFVRDSAGTVNGIIIRQGGRDMSAKKIR